MHIYKRHLGDYAKDTRHLSLLEHGAYTLMLDYVYGTEKGLPDEVGALFRLCGALNAGERSAVLSVRKEFFTQMEDGSWMQKRVLVEIEGYRGKSNKARSSANARWKSCVSDANALPTDSDGNANHKPITNNQEPSPISPEGTGRVWEPSELQKRLNGWFKRRDSTRWSEKELRAFRQLPETAEEDLELLGRYTMQCQYARKDMLTLLNNWQGDLDRARGWNTTVLQNQNGVEKKERGAGFQDELIGMPVTKMTEPEGWQVVADELYDFDWAAMWPGWAVVPVSNRNEIQAALIKKEKAVGV